MAVVTDTQLRTVEHLTGRDLPPLILPATNGQNVLCTDLAGWSVFYFYPRTSPSEVMTDLGLTDAVHADPMRVAYHAACSLQHGQQIKTYPKLLLKAAGFEVAEPKDSHLCCGSAGTYNLMQPEISA